MEFARVARIGAHTVGDIGRARTDFTRATELAGQALSSVWGSKHARHYLDLGDLAAARSLCDHGLNAAGNFNHNIPRFHTLLARIDIAENSDPTSHLDEVRAWTSRTGDRLHRRGTSSHRPPFPLLRRSAGRPRRGRSRTSARGRVRIRAAPHRASRRARADPPGLAGPAAGDPGGARGARSCGTSRLPVRMGRGGRRPSVGRGVFRQPRAHAREACFHPRPRGAQAHRAPGRRRDGRSGSGGPNEGLGVRGWGLGIGLEGSTGSGRQASGYGLRATGLG